MRPPIRPERHSMPPPEDYFKGVSPMCRRILDEMSSISESYGEKWYQLSYDEQCRILDQAIVDEATVRKYEIKTASSFDCEYFPKLKISTGQKIISDEKLSARGYTCSWRDEHSAPFSWHTRSQMDLTLETPPPTPTQSCTSPLTASKEALSVRMQTKKNGLPEKNESLSSISIEQCPKTAPFLWHYEPHPDLKGPEPPDLVIDTPPSHCKTAPVLQGTLVRRGSTFNHLVVTSEDQKSILGWFRGAIAFITNSCLPIHSCRVDKGPLLHPSSPFIHPELRPPHVIAKAAKVTLPIMNQSKIKSKPIIDKSTKDIQLSPPTGLQLKKQEDPKISNSNSNKLYDPSIRKEIQNISHSSDKKNKMEEVVNQSPSKLAKENNKLDFPEHKETNSGEKRADEEVPLIALSGINKATIPKTGFDFLDNW